MTTTGFQMHETALKDIPDLRIRHFQDDSDRASIVDILEGSRVTDQDTRAMSYEQLLALHRSTSQWCFEDAMLAEVAGMAVGFSDSHHFAEGAGTRIYWHTQKVLPTWRGKGIERLLVEQIERRLHAIAADNPGPEARFLQSHVSDTEHEREAVLQQLGYTAARHTFHMLRSLTDDLTPGQLPEGIELRPVEIEHLRQINDAVNEAFENHWGASRLSADEFQTWILERPGADLRLWQVAWSGDEVVGAVIVVVDEKENTILGKQRGYLETIFVRQPWRRQGLAHTLIARSLHALTARGMAEATLHVDTENENGALGLYERVGFRAMKRFTAYRKPLDV